MGTFNQQQMIVVQLSKLPLLASVSSCMQWGHLYSCFKEHLPYTLIKDNENANKHTIIITLERWSYMLPSLAPGSANSLASMLEAIWCIPTDLDNRKYF